MTSAYFFGWDYTINKQEKLHDNEWIERPIFLQNESIRIDSHNESNRIDSNRELECSTARTTTSTCFVKAPQKKAETALRRRYVPKKYVIIPARAVLTRVLAWPRVRLSVCLCLSQVGVISKGIDGLTWFWHGGFFRPVLHCVIGKFRHLYKNKVTSLWNFF